jgi:EpsI family protein
VIEACSGVRYLIASVMVGSLFAYLNYRSLRRRVLFIGVSIVVPLVANWLRAYMIVMIGHLSNNTLAVGVDHLIYGWVFFGIVIGLMFWIGARWAEPEPPPAPAASAGVTTGAVAGAGPWVMLVAMLALIVGSYSLQARLSRSVDTRPVELVLPPELGEHGTLPFIPGFRGATAHAAALHQGAQPVWLWVGYYRKQREGDKLVSSMNKLVARDDRERWMQVSRGEHHVSTPSVSLPVRTGELREATSMYGGSPQRLRVWQLYWVGGRFVASDARAKLLQALDRLRGGDDDGAVLLLVTPQTDTADAALKTYIVPRLAAVDEWLTSVRGAR